MQGIENKLLVLKLNKKWQRVGQSIVKDALIDLAAGINSVALDIDYARREDGTVDFNNPIQTRPVEWDEWITLPIREWDFSIRTSRQEVRVPTILVAKNYEEMPKVRVGKKPTAEQVYLRDGLVCQYTGRKLRREEASLDHVVPKSRGGDNSWTNIVTADKEVNRVKGNKLNKEAGLQLLRVPVKPKEIPRSMLITEARHRDWRIFLEKK